MQDSVASLPSASDAPTTVAEARDYVADLTVADVQAICRELSLPTPTPDVPLSAILERARLTPADVYVRLERATRVDAMIAAAALRGAVKKLPRDKRLDPEPHRLRWSLTEEGRAVAADPVKRRAATERRAAADVDPGMPPEGHVVTSVGDCGSAPGSKRALRFAAYKVGLTIPELRDAGLKASDIRRHVAEGVVTFGPREG